MTFCDIEEALKEIKAGKMLVLVDDEDRENEGDLVMAAEKITPDAVNFMAKYGRGLICLAMSSELINKLNLAPMTANNQAIFGTNFTVSIEARYGVSTGISAFDRATTILTAIADNAKPDDVVSPGHVFPLCAHDGGVLKRSGQTEGSVDLAKLAGYKACAVICEIMNDDGTMARFRDLERFAEKHRLKICAIKDLIKYRLRHDKSLIKKISSAKLPNSFGDFVIHAYESSFNSLVHLALVKGELNNNVNSNAPILVRVHSECLTGDVFSSKRCDCGEQLQEAMRLISNEPRGVLLYLRQEGRGIGLGNKIRAYALQDQGCDTVEANLKLGFADDLRDYGIGAQILLDLGVTKMHLLTNNPEKINSLSGGGLEVVKNIPLQVKSNKNNIHYLKTKKKKWDIY